MMDNNYLLKHSAAIHICNVLTLTQRKVANILLKEAFANLDKDIVHTIPISKIIALLGWNASSEATKLLRNSFKELNAKQIEWNIFQKDRSQTWGVTTLLAYVQINKGIVEYSYSKPLREMLFKPNIYARLDLFVQKNFSNKHALALWEYVTEYLCSSRSQTTQTQNISLEDLRRYLGIEDCKAYSSFFALNAKVIQPAIKEINNKSDLVIQCNFNKQGTRVVSLSFDVRRKENLLKSYSNVEDIKDTVGTNPLNFQVEGESLGISQTLLTKHVSIYGEERVQKAINFVQQAVKEGKKIKSIPAYYSSCLQNNWETSLPYSLIEKPPEPDFMDLVGKNELHVNALNTLFNKIGGNSYKSWFQEVEFQRVEKHKLCVQTPSKFAADYINSHFSTAIIEAWRDSGEEIQQLEIFKA